jgi:hypothetical protein
LAGAALLWQSVRYRFSAASGKDSESAPSITGFFFGKDIAQSIKEPASIRVVTEYLPSVDASGDNVVKTTGSIYMGLAWHKMAVQILG